MPVFGQSGDLPLVTENVFDKAGNIIEAIDPAGNRTRNVYDGAGRLIATATNPVSGTPSADPLGSPGANDIVIRNDYDNGGNLLRVYDGLDQVTDFTYDGLSRKLSRLKKSATHPMLDNFPRICHIPVEPNPSPCLIPVVC